MLFDVTRSFHIFFFKFQSIFINRSGLVVIHLYLNWFLLSASKSKAYLALVFSFLNFGVSWVNFITLYNVCSVHRGMFSTSGGVQYIGGDTMSTSGGYHEYIGGIS